MLAGASAIWLGLSSSVKVVCNLLRTYTEPETFFRGKSRPLPLLRRKNDHLETGPATPYGLVR
jgi:hypothetical protein